MIVRLAQAILFLFAPCLLPSIALFGRRFLSLIASSLLTAIFASISGIVAIALGDQPLPWFLGMIGLANIAATVALTKKHQNSVPRRQTATEAIMLAVSALPLLGLRRPAIDWDTRSIWLFHARWFFAGGKYVQNAFGNPAFEFSHVDYPPLVAAAVGTLWKLGQEIDPHLGQILIGLLTFSAVGMLSIALISLAPSRLLTPAAAIGGVVAIGSFGISGPTGTNGYVDLLSAASAVSASIYLLVASASRRNIAAGALCAIVSGLTKNEGLVLGLFILIMAGIRHRHHTRNALLFGCASLGLTVWPILSQQFGARSDLVPTQLSGRTLERFWSRLATAAEAVWIQSGPMVIAAICCLILGWLSLKTIRRRLDFGHPWWFWSVFLVSVVSLLLAYGISPNPIHWHLATSVQRTTIPVRLLALSDIAVWCVCSLLWLTSRSGTLRDDSHCTLSRELTPEGSRMSEQH